MSQDFDSVEASKLSEDELDSVSGGGSRDSTTARDAEAAAKKESEAKAKRQNQSEQKAKSSP